MTRVDGLAVVRNGNVRIKQHRSIKYLHDLSVLLKNEILFFLLRLLHVLRHNFKSCHFLLWDIFFKLFFGHSKFLNIDFNLFHINIFSLGIELFFFFFFNYFLIDLSFGLTLYFLIIFDFHSLTIDFWRKFFDCLHFNFRAILFLLFRRLLFQTFYFTSAFFTIENVKDSIVAMFRIKRTENLPNKCQYLIETIATSQRLLRRLSEKEWLSSYKSGLDRGFFDFIFWGKAQINLVLEGCWQHIIFTRM